MPRHPTLLPDPSLMCCRECGRPGYDPRALQELARLRVDQDAADVLATMLEASREPLPANAVAFLGWLVPLVREVPSCVEIARLAGVRASTLTSRFDRARLPAARLHVVLIRMIYARMYVGRGCSVTVAAYRIGASSPQAFARTVRELYGMTAKHWATSSTLSKLAGYTVDRLFTPAARRTWATFTPFSLELVSRPTFRAPWRLASSSSSGSPA